MAKFLLIELNPERVSFGEPSNLLLHERSSIHEHLKYYCSKFSLLPTIEIKVLKDSIVATEHSQYLKIAKELDRPIIRAIVHAESDRNAVEVLLKQSDVEQLDWDEIMSQEDELCDYMWFVFFFEKCLEEPEKILFEQNVVAYHRDVDLPDGIQAPSSKIKNLSYPYSGQCAEFQAYLPVEDYRWLSGSLKVVTDFHLQCVPIVSFQGLTLFTESTPLGS